MGENTMGFNFLEGINVETTHVGKKLLGNNNFMEVEWGEVVVILRTMIVKAYVEE
jgi:hypothetical protein